MIELVGRASRTVVLNSAAARSCPVKTQNANLALLDEPHRDPDPGTAAREASRRSFRAQVLDACAAASDDTVDLRRLADEPVEVRVEACRSALRAGASLIIGGTLPVDLTGRRVGTPDVLVRGADRAGTASRPGYHPVVVKWHRIISPNRPESADPDPSAERTQLVPYSTVASPAPSPDRHLSGFGLRLAYREGDFLQLAHYVRMLEAAGHDASGRSWGGVIGTDEVPDVGPARSPGDRLIVWADLTEPSVRSFSGSDPRGWQLRSLLERYDDEHRFRIAIAQSARQQSGNPGVDPPLLVGPIVNRECASCPWWQVCRPQLDDDDLNLRLERGPLGAREIIALRAAGIVTVHQLAASDLDALLAGYLPAVSHCVGAERRLRTAARRARMLVAGTAFERESSGPIEVPAADLEIDFDLETAADGRIYLWGFRVQSATSEPYVRQFCRFAELDDDTELALAREALGWLRRSVTRRDRGRGSASALVYHYSGFEVAMLEALAARSGDPLLRWGAELATGPGFVDMLEVIKPHYFGVAGLGLKSIAQHAGFRWRDADPGGLNSQRWFDEAVHGEADRRALARRRVLEYNEDDVIATGWLREWLRAQ